MNQSNPIVPPFQQPLSDYLVSGDLPTWEQIPPDCQQELIQTLADLLVKLPEIHALLEVPDEPQQ